MSENLSYFIYGDFTDSVEKLEISEETKIFFQTMVRDDSIRDFPILNRVLFIDIYKFMDYLKDKSLPTITKKAIYYNIEYFNICSEFTIKTQNFLDMVSQSLYSQLKKVQYKYFSDIQTDYNKPASEGKAYSLKIIPLKEVEQPKVKMIMGKFLRQNFDRQIYYLKNILSVPHEVTPYFLKYLIKNLSEYLGYYTAFKDGFTDEGLKEEYLNDSKPFEDIKTALETKLCEITSILNQSDNGMVRMSVNGCTQPRIMIDQFMTPDRGYMYAVTAVTDSGMLTYTDILGYGETIQDAEEKCFLSLYDKWVKGEQIQPRQ